MISRKIFFLFLIFILISSPQFANKKVSKLKKKKEQLYEIHKQIKEKKQKLREVKKKEKKISVELQQTEEKLEKTKEELGYVSLKLNQEIMKKAVVTENLKEAKKEFAKEQKELITRLTQIYKYGTIKYWEVLLESKDFWDFLTRVRFLKKILDKDIALLKRIKEIRDKIAKRQKELIEKCKEISIIKGEVTKKKEEIGKQAKEKARILKSIKEERAAYERALAELEQNSREIEAMIKKLEAAQKFRAYVPYKFKGSFIWPVSGRIVSGYGWRVHPIFKIRRFHTGIDISAASGTPIYAAASGVVIFSGWWGGYGKVVIIHHGSEITTLYAHCSEIIVSNNQEVRKGQIIGYVDSTGFSTGPHLHFEVRRNGSPVNPLGR